MAHQTAPQEEHTPGVPRRASRRWRGSFATALAAFAATHAVAGTAPAHAGITAG